MKRTATTLALLAGFGGGCVSPGGTTATNPGQPPASAGGFGTVTHARGVPGLQGPTGEPVPVMAAARGAMPGGVVPAGGMVPAGEVKQAGHKGGVGGEVVGGMPAGPAGPMGPVPPYGWGGAPPNTGILPVPGMGPPGAVAAVGAIVPGMRPPAVNMRTSVRFTGPAGMKITWQLPGGGFNDEASGLTAPKEYNFVQGQVYRLRLTQVLPNFPGRTFYPTLEVTPANPKTITFLSHSSVPVTFTNEDFDQAVAGNLVVKVIYLPDPAYQDFAVVAGAEEIVSTRLEPGADPVAEAQRRGSILAIIRLGNIDLENRASPAMTAPPGGGMPGLPPGAMLIPPGATPPAGAVPATPARPMPPTPGPGSGMGTAPPPLAPSSPPGSATVGKPGTLPPIPAAPIAPTPPSNGGTTGKTTNTGLPTIPTFSK